MRDQAHQRVLVAGTQTRTRQGLLQRQCACGQHTGGGGCEACRKRRDSTLELATITRGPVSIVPPSVQDGLRSSGQPCDAGLRVWTEPRFGHDFSRIPLHAPAVGSLQTKLAINKPGDEYEQEADHVSEQVMRMPEPQRQCALASGGGGSRFQTEQPSRGQDRLQTRRVQSSESGQTAVPHIVNEVLASPGQPLDPSARAFMEPRFGHDFSQVRVHTDAKAAKSADALNARAYTVGADIVFGQGEYPYGTELGRFLLAHELTHVVQQRGASPAAQTAGTVSDPSDASEREAEAVAERAVAGERVRVSAPPTSSIARERRSPDARSRGYQSFYLNGVVPAANTQMRVQFYQDPSAPSAATLAVWYQESNTLQRVSFDPGGTIQAAVLSEEPGIVTFDLNGDEAPEIVLTARPNASLGLDFAADFRGRRILNMTTAPPQPRAPPYVAGRGRLIGQLPDGRNYYWTGAFDQRGPRYVDDNGTMVDPGQAAAGAAINNAFRNFFVGWMILSAVAGLALLGAAIVAEAVPATAGSYAGLTNAQIARQLIGAEQTALLRTFFGTGLRGAAARAAAFEIPAGLTRASLLAYAEIARRVIAAGADTLGVQAARLQLIERALRLLP